MHLVLQSLPTHVNKVVMEWRGILQFAFEKKERLLNLAITIVLFANDLHRLFIS